MAKVTIVIEDSVGDYLKVKFTPSLREIAAKGLSGVHSPAFKYAMHIGNFLKLGLGKDKAQKKEDSRIIQP